jgi:hypothetical protein
MQKPFSYAPYLNKRTSGGDMGKCKKLNSFSYLILSVGVFLLGLTGVAVFGFLLLVLIAFMPEGQLSNWLNILADIGTLAAGLGTIALGLTAFFVYGEWKKQFGTEYPKECGLACL